MDQLLFKYKTPTTGANETKGDELEHDGKARDAVMVREGGSRLTLLRKSQAWSP